MISYISIGSNIGDRITNIYKAIYLLSKKVHILKKSSFYITKPMYYTFQPYFINLVIKIESSLNPFCLLNYLNFIEDKLKRKRSFKNSPRTIDLDILYFGNDIINTQKLIVPHPKIYERAFVLKPFMDIDPGFIDPIKNKKISEIFNSLKYNSSDVIKIPEKFNDIESFFAIISPRKKSDFNTSYIKNTLSVFGKPQKNCGKIIHITGSVGKTTTARYIYEIIRKKGFDAALYTSPHIHNLRERIIFNDKKIPEKDFYKILIKLISNSKEMLSPFEYITSVAIIYFSSKNPTYSIFEVGMGGESDATNVFDKSFSVFTKITLEHQKYLGKRISYIVKNKAGIIKPYGKVFISGQNSKKVIDLINFFSKRKRSKVYVFDVNKKNNDFESINLNFAKFICSKLGIRVENSKFRKFDCRKQILKYNGIRIIFDGAHTPLSIKMLFESIKDDDYKFVLAGFMNDKKIKQMLEIIKTYNLKIFLSKSYSPRSFDPFKYSSYGLCFDDPKVAISKILKYKKNFIVTGSLYFCSDILKILQHKEISYFRELI